MCILNSLDSETIVAICALVVSIVSIFISIRSLSIQRTYNEKSVRPIAHLTNDDYENEISVELRNVGVGPLIIKELKVQSQNGKELTNLIDFVDLNLPDGLMWTNFVKQTTNRAIAIGDKICLLSINFDNVEYPDKDSARQIPRFRSDLRKLLGDLTVTVKYTGIYEKDILVYTRTLDWYKRHS
jgi:hypothetical protein